MAERRFQLERFYYGVFNNGKKGAKPGLLARSPEVPSETIWECLQFSRLEPPPPDRVTPEMKTSLGLFRGEKTEFILSVAGMSPHKTPQLLYVLLPAEVLRWLGGNWSTFLELGRNDMPAFTSQQTDLPPIVLEDPQPDTPEEQAEAVGDFMLNCQDNIKTVEGILTALIIGANIAIINAPRSLETRLHFLEGLNAFLPPPARVGLTFATNVIKKDNSLAQIKFMAGNDIQPGNHIIYDWDSGKLMPDTFEKHDYARFIISQLRLDPSKVVEQTESLTRTAVWRAIRKDDLANALYWASRRARIDSTVKAGQPADRALVASVLRQDPTLPDDLRIAYTRHLLSFTLPLRDWETAEIIPVIAGSHSDVATAIFEQLREAAQGEQSLNVFELIEYWIKNVSATEALPWQRVLHMAAMAHLEKLIEARDQAGLAEFVERLSDPTPALQFAAVAPQIGEKLWPIASVSSSLAMALLLLVADHLPPATLQALIHNDKLLPRYPEPIQAAFRAFKKKPSGPGVLTRALDSIPESHRATVLIRLVEIAVQMERYYLIDEYVLAHLIPMINDEKATRYRGVFHYLLEDFQRPERIRTLGKNGVTLLPRLYFASRQIEDGVYLLENYQNELFAKKPDEFTDLVGRLFLKLDMPQSYLKPVLEAINSSRLLVTARARALCAALISQEWSPIFKQAADWLESMLFADPELVNTIRLENAIHLLEFYKELKRLPSIIRVGSAIVEVLPEMGKSGPPVMVEICKKLQNDDNNRAAAYEMLRKYIRLMEPEATRLYPMYFRKQISDEAGDVVEAARLMRGVLGKQDLVKFAEDVTTTAKLFTDIAVTYHASRENPSVIRLKQSLDAMSGGLDEKERQHLTSNISQIAYLIFTLGTESETDKDGKLRKTTTSRTRRQLEELPDETPRTAISFLRWLGYYFHEHLIIDLRLNREAPAHVLGARSATVFYYETNTIVNLLQRLQEAFGDQQDLSFPPDILKAEIESLWSQFMLYTQRQIKPVLSTHTQELAILLQLMASHATPKTLTDTSYTRNLEAGRNQPKSELEALRWISGYFGRKHR